MVKGQLFPRGLGASFLTPIFEELIKRGHEVIIFTLDKQITEETVLVGKNMKIYINNYRERHRGFNFFKTEIKNLKQMIIKENVDILHAHWTYEFAISALLTHEKVLVTAHDSPIKVLKYMPDFYRFVRMIMAYYALGKTHLLSVVSEDTADHLRKYKFYNRQELYTIPNPIKINNIINCENIEVTNDEIVFAAVMNGWVKLKNPIILLKAFQQLKLKHKNVRLVLIGKDYGEKEHAHIWAVENNCFDGVTFLGEMEREKVHEILNQKVDVLVHPSLEESFSLIIAEAMKLGIPVIGGICSGAVPYTMGKGISGLLVNMRSFDELLTAMEKMLDKDLRIEFGTKGNYFATENYDLNKVVDQYEKLYYLLYLGK